MADASPELLPCPFCGGSADEDHAPDCWFKLREAGQSKSRMAEAWNRRATLPSPSEDEMRERRHAEALSKLMAPSPSTAPEATIRDSRTVAEVDEREAFEAWAVTAGPWDGPLQWGRHSNGEYKHSGIEGDWKVWQARAALASRPAEPSLKPVHERENAESSKRAEVDDEGLPDLPKAAGDIDTYHQDGRVTSQDGYTAEQYRQGQRDAVAADRARMPDPKEISDAITEAYNVAYVDRDWKATDYWRDLGKRFSAWAAPSHTTNKEK